MSKERLELLEERLLEEIRQAEPAAASGAGKGFCESSLQPALARALFEDQVQSRALDITARALRRDQLSYYTIASAGHEQNAVLGALLEPDDPCFLHYRSGALVLARARRAGYPSAVHDILLSLCASSQDPIAQGRHKVWGSRPLWIIPQTSTIASHLPKSVGFAFALSRKARLGLELPVSRNAIVCCSFGDASVNHASALSGFNAARYAQRRGHAIPILFVCEDNGIGISEVAPRDWIRDSFEPLPGISYFQANGSLLEVWRGAEQAIQHCRRTRSPVFLHLQTTRLGGHAGSDVESGYRTPREIEATEEHDPLRSNARLLIESGIASPDELTELVRRIREETLAEGQRAASAPKLSDPNEITDPIHPFNAAECRESVPSVAAETRHQTFNKGLPEDAPLQHRTLAFQINAALSDSMLAHPEIVIFGQDVAKKGGVYGVTSQLQKRFGVGRVFDTQLDETTILGSSQGLALAGLLPIAEIQYLAYVHNAIDQLRGEACSQAFFSSGQFRNPMLVRLASFAYQKGFGGHFHNENAIGALREIPGLVLAAPCRGDDAARMLRGVLAMAKCFGRVACFLEPVALYFERDLHEIGDQGWLFDYPSPEQILLPGEVGIYGEENSDLLIASYANGLRFALRAARRLEAEHGLQARVLDLRWLNPLPFDAVRKHAAECKAVLVVDECRRTGGGVADAIIADLVESMSSSSQRKIRAVRAADTYIPLGPAADAVLISEEDVLRAALELCSA